LSPSDLETPYFTALDRPAMMAIGTARIRGQGVAMRNTTTARMGSALKKVASERAKVVGRKVMVEML
jgi:hypothetical protein